MRGPRLCGETARTPVMKVKIGLPAHPDTAMDLGGGCTGIFISVNCIEPGRADICTKFRILRAIARQAGCRIQHRFTRHFIGDVHFGNRMLDRLELADGLAECLQLIGELACHLDAFVRSADRFRSQVQRKPFKAFDRGCRRIVEVECQCLCSIELQVGGAAVVVQRGQWPLSTLSVSSETQTSAASGPNQCEIGSRPAQHRGLGARQPSFCECKLGSCGQNLCPFGKSDRTAQRAGGNAGPPLPQRVAQIAHPAKSMCRGPLPGTAPPQGPSRPLRQRSWHRRCPCQGRRPFRAR